MQFGTVMDATGHTTAAIGDLNGWRALPFPDLSVFLRAGTTGAMEEAASLVGERLADVTPVLPLPTPGKVICCGLNYGDHILETGRALPAFPTLFAKYADTLLGPYDDIVLPNGLQVDWEAELAVVVGSTIRGVDAGAAQAAIAGYTVANDISVRDWQGRTLQWFQGKAWDRTTPVGPVVVTPDDVDETVRRFRRRLLDPIGCGPPAARGRAHLEQPQAARPENPQGRCAPVQAA